MDKERKIGEVFEAIIDDKRVTLEVVESSKLVKLSSDSDCEHCAFFQKNPQRCKDTSLICASWERSDVTNIVFKLI